MRLGDLDELVRAIKKIKCPQGASMGDGLADACQAVLEAPTVDAVPVVRCKDCKHRNHTGSGFPWCDVWGENLFSDDGFCSYGERKDGD